MSKNLVSIPTLVESPFIIVKIADVTFGTYTTKTPNPYGGMVGVTYPNFMESLEVNKVNGQVNTYTIRFKYQVRFGDDPNLLDRIFSKASSTRLVSLKYGDWNAPEYIYKEEQCIITGLRSQLNVSQATINYTMTCVSDAIGLAATPQDFPERYEKPSDVIIAMIQSNRYGFKRVFGGMRNLQRILESGVLATNDKRVRLLAQRQVTPLAYLQYLVSCMINERNTNVEGVVKSFYTLTFHDDYSNEFGGTYFSIKEISSNDNTKDSPDTYTIDVNFPGDNFVTQFSLNDDQNWALLYDYQGKINQEEYSYTLNNDGTYTTNRVPPMMKSTSTNEMSPTKLNWWSKMVEFPVQATLTLKGLTRPSMLMTHIRVNVLFSGGIKHVSSGLYIITKQVDKIDSSGYRTTFSLLRIPESESVT